MAYNMYVPYVVHVHKRTLMQSTSPRWDTRTQSGRFRIIEALLELEVPPTGRATVLVRFYRLSTVRAERGAVTDDDPLSET